MSMIDIQYNLVFCLKSQILLQLQKTARDCQCLSDTGSPGHVLTRIINQSAQMYLFDTVVERNAGNLSLTSLREQLATRLTPVCFQNGNLIIGL